MINAGFVVNPYAGMGGAVGLKGTDGCVDEAVARGAVKVSPIKALRFLSNLMDRDIFYFTAAGELGDDILKSAGISRYEVIYPLNFTDRYNNNKTGPEDTKAACRIIAARNADLIIFSGGDGTARDVYEAVGDHIPILGIPAGVKIYSGVFATTPDTAADILKRWESVLFTDAEILDVDEEQYRLGNLDTNLFGIAKIPYIKGLCQSCKQASFGDDREDRIEIGAFIVDIMADDTLYLLGAGSTTKAITERLGIRKTLLGIDAVYQGQLIATDLNEAGILELLRSYKKVRIILSPVGSQGFILGRGNQQISSRVLSLAGVDSLIVVATQAKMQQTPDLYIDTGDPDLNHKFGDTIPVICGYRLAIRAGIIHN